MQQALRIAIRRGIANFARNFWPEEAGNGGLRSEKDIS